MVVEKGQTVFVDGLGFSVREKDVESFIEKQRAEGRVVTTSTLYTPRFPTRKVVAPKEELPMTTRETPTPTVSKEMPTREFIPERKTAIERIKIGEPRTRVFITSKKDFVPVTKDPYVIVFTDPFGRTTGETSMEGFIVPTGFRTSEEYKVDGKVVTGASLLGQDIRKSISREFSMGVGGEIASSSIVSAYEPPTLAQLKESQFLSETYGGNGGILGFLGGRVKEVFLDPFATLITPKGDLSGEAFSLQQMPSKTGFGSTAIYEPKKDISLSESALLYKRGVQEEFPEIVGFEESIKQKREAIISKISPSGITEREVRLGTKELQEYHKIKAEEFAGGFKERAKKREQLIFEERHPYEVKVQKIIPEIKFLEEFKPYEVERQVWGELYEKGITPSGRKLVTTTLVGGTTFLKGVYTGVKQKPLKAVTSLGVGVALTIATVGLGSAAISGGYIGARTLGVGTKIIGGAALTGYGVGVGARIGLTSGKFEKFGTAGEIFGTEVAPFIVGAGVGRYGVRRVTAYSELRKYTKQLPMEQQKIFKSQLKEAKTFYRVQPTVKELDLSRLELLEGSPVAQKALINYFARRKGIIVGGSIAQQTQVYGVKTKRPGDIDIYVKGLVREPLTSLKYAREVSGILKKYGISAEARAGKVKIGGKKLIEFHPYKSYLRYNIEQVAPWYRTARSAITTTPEGVKVLRVSVQFQRKLVGGYLEPYMTGKVRLKDVPAAMAIRGSLIKTRGLQLQEIGRSPQPISFGVREVELGARGFQEIGFPKVEVGIGGVKGLLKPQTLKRVKSTLIGGEISGGGFKFEYPFYKPTSKILGYYPSKLPPSVSYYFYKPSSYKPSPPIPNYSYKPSPKVLDSYPYTPTKEGVLPSPHVSTSYLSRITPLPPPIIYAPSTLSSRKKKGVLYGDVDLLLPEDKIIITPTRKFVRVPSFVSVTFGIVGKPTRGEVTGFAERPLLRPLGQQQFKPFASLLGKIEVKKIKLKM